MEIYNDENLDRLKKRKKYWELDIELSHLVNPFRNEIISEENLHKLQIILDRFVDDYKEKGIIRKDFRGMSAASIDNNIIIRYKDNPLITSAYKSFSECYFSLYDEEFTIEESVASLLIYFGDIRFDEKDYVSINYEEAYINLKEVNNMLNNYYKKEVCFRGILNQENELKIYNLVLLNPNRYDKDTNYLSY